MIVCWTVIPLMTMVHWMMIIVGFRRVIRFRFMIVGGFIRWRLSGGIIGFWGRWRTIGTLRWRWTIGTMRWCQWRSIIALVAWRLSGIMMPSVGIFSNFMRIKMHRWWIIAIIIFIIIISIIIVIF